MCTNVCSDRLLPGSLYLVSMKIITALMAENFMFLKKSFFLWKSWTFLASLFDKINEIGGFLWNAHPSSQFCLEKYRKNDFFKKIKFSAIRAVVVVMQTKYNNPGSSVSLQTFVHKILPIFRNPDSFRSLPSWYEYNNYISDFMISPKSAQL